jgi:hypothetical protein
MQKKIVARAVMRPEKKPHHKYESRAHKLLWSAFSASEAEVMYAEAYAWRTRNTALAPETAAAVEDAKQLSDKIAKALFD